MIWKICVGVIAVAALTMSATATAAKPVLDVRPNQVRFGSQPYETFETRTVTVTNRSSNAVTLTSEAGLPDDFSHLIDSTCGLGDKVLAPRETCTHVVGFRPTPFFEGVETATLVLTARDATGAIVDQLTVTITGRGV
jgi:hypothetical protein